MKPVCTLIDQLSPVMPWDELDAVVFDVGNVLLRFEPAELAAKVFPDDPAAQQTVLRLATGTPYWPMLDRGLISLDDAAVRMAGRETSAIPVLDRFMHGWVELPPIREGFDALRIVKAHGKRTYILSNYNAEAYDIVRSLYEPLRQVDGELISSTVGITKPDLAIFRLAEERFSLTPERTLFIDDSYINVEAALAKGWHAFWNNESGKLLRYLSA